MLRLRPHHINCLFFYRGMGYSKEFIEKMNKISDELKEKPSIKVMLIDSCDNICEKCPNRNGKSCVTEDKILMLDKATLSEYNLQLNKEYDFNTVVTEIYKNFTKENLENMCNTCEWYKKDVCSKDRIEEQKILWKIKYKE